MHHSNIRGAPETNSRVGRSRSYDKTITGYIHSPNDCSAPIKYEFCFAIQKMPSTDPVVAGYASGHFLHLQM